eukprot:CAMPEP_0182853880 /NCGR_PEP_ID=MMETSP0034_2-20130328/942_1 /TAXON_ID=156128 /ORGANISM="Nephroselmis pyriformis, Strain CCMP717" /LENGTH=57 /DNA_ID=CAMNT_0024984665 /DNA_START=249 /DNA_END=418 /DNA_ORIENTATION=-
MTSRSDVVRSTPPQVLPSPAGLKSHPAARRALCPLSSLVTSGWEGAAHGGTAGGRAG